MLCSSFLLDVDLMLVDALVGSPVDTLVGAHGVLSRCLQEDHVLAELLKWHGELWLFSRCNIIFCLVLRFFEICSAIRTLLKALKHTKDFPIRMLLGFDES